MAEPTPAMPKCNNATNSHRRAPSVKHGGMPIYQGASGGIAAAGGTIDDKPRAEAELILIMPGAKEEKPQSGLK